MAKKLYDLYGYVSPPKILQCDNGREFKKGVECLCHKLEVKIIRGSPYYPQSQGNVERSQRSIRKKLVYDFVDMSRVGVNWVSQLNEYEKILNEKPMAVLGNHSPFEYFYGKESNSRNHL